MKLRKCVLPLALSLVAVAAFTGCSSSETTKSDVGMTEATSLKIMVDGVERVLTDADGNEVYPVLYQDVVYVPASAFAEQLGKDASWDAENCTLKVNNGSLTKEDAEAGKKVIETFFDDFNAGDFYEMKLLSTGETSAWDFRDGVFGMAEAKLTDCTLDESAFDSGKGILAYTCQFDMTPSPDGTLSPDETTFSCIVVVDKVDENYLISGFYTGL